MAAIANHSPSVENASSFPKFKLAGSARLRLGRYSSCATHRLVVGLFVYIIIESLFVATAVTYPFGEIATAFPKFKLETGAKLLRVSSLNTGLLL